MSAAPIWVIDDIVTRPGQGQAFLESYMRDYAPGAIARGMTLAHRMVEPAMWLDDASNRILLVWTLPDPGTVWAAKHAARGDEAVLRWWNEEAVRLILSRRRATLADADMLEALADV